MLPIIYLLNKFLILPVEEPGTDGYINLLKGTVNGSSDSLNSSNDCFEPNSGKVSRMLLTTICTASTCNPSYAGG
jgi:hypothetical protein